MTQVPAALYVTVPEEMEHTPAPEEPSIEKVTAFGEAPPVADGV
jgi:hypothetical protein